MPIKRRASRGTGASSSTAPPPSRTAGASSSAAPPPPQTIAPTIKKNCMPRYNTLIQPKMLHKVERRLVFREFPGYGLQQTFEAIGIEDLVDVWESPYCMEFVLAFIAHLSVDKKTKVFSTEVQNVRIEFTAESLCREYHLPTAGVDVYDPQSEGAFLMDQALEFVLGPNFQGLRKKKLVRSMLRRDEHKLLTYILHNNVMPRGGKANDEVPNNILQFICAAYHDRAINFIPILQESFERLAKKNVKFVGYHKLITSMCLLRGVGLGVWERVQGEVVDKKKLRAMHLPERPGGDDDDDDDDSEGDGDRTGTQPGGADTEGAETEGAHSEGESEEETLAAYTRRVHTQGEAQHKAIMDRLNEMQAVEQVHHQAYMARLDQLERRQQEDRVEFRAGFYRLHDEVRQLRTSRPSLHPRGSSPTSSAPGPY